MKRTRLAIFGATLAMAIASCASSPAGAPVSPTSDERRDAEELSLEVEREERALTEALAGARCEQACAAGARLCELAARICEIAERNEGHREIEARCEDGAVRCERARTRISDSCQCDAGGEAGDET